MTNHSQHRDPVEALAEEFLARRRAGETPSIESYASAHPELADEIRDLFQAMMVMERLKPAGDSASDNVLAQVDLPSMNLGEYHIVREIGRGGMGVVYEAEQESLGRRVAIKLLPNHALLPDTHVKRFELEAKAAASLHHTNIVPVFGIGKEEALHFYVMQYIHGCGLDVVLKQLRRLRSGDNGGEQEQLVSSVAHSLLSTTPDAVDGGKRHTAFGKPTPDQSASASVALPGQETLGDSTTTGRVYWQSVARIGEQVASALHYAHGQGVLHRDIKPSNLLLDTAGNVWVTDFGLAKIVEGDNLTRSGDVVGTLRYMAPERFRGESSAASDIYGLGATLYELLTMRPAYDAADVQKFVADLSRENPTPPRAIDPRIPIDLQTIVMTAMASEPNERYKTSGTLSDDLKRFREGRPIVARQASLLDRARKFVNRKPVISTLGASLVVMAMVAAAGITWQWREATTQRDLADKEATRAKEQAKLATVRGEENKALAAKERKARKEMKVERDLANEARADTDTANARLNYSLAIARWKAGRIREAEALLDLVPPEHRHIEWFVAKRQIHGSDITLHGHTTTVNCVRFDRTGTRVLSTSFDGTVRLWHAVTGEELSKFRSKETGIPSCADFAPTGRRYAIGTNSGSILLCSEDGEPEIVAAHKKAIKALAFSRDGQRFVTASQDGTIRICDGESLQLENTLQSDQPVTQLCLSQDGTVLASTGSGKGMVQLWNLESGQQTDSFKAHDSSVNGISFSPTGDRIVTAGNPNSFASELRMWDAETREQLWEIESEDRIDAVAVSPDGGRVAVGFGHEIRILETNTGDVLGVLRGHTNHTVSRQQAGVNSLAFERDGSRIVSGGVDGRVKLWDAASLSNHRVISPRVGTITAAEFSTDSSIVAIAAGNFVELRDVKSGKQLFQRRRTGSALAPISLRPDGKCVAWSDGKLVRVADPNSDKEPMSVQHESNVVCVQFSPNGETIATAAGKTATIWNAATGEELATMTDSGSIRGAWFDPSGTKVVTAGAQLAVWTTSGKQLCKLGHRRKENTTSMLLRARFSKGSKRVFAQDIKYELIEQWDVDNRDTLPPLAVKMRPTAFATNLDGTRMATVSESGLLRLWDTETREELCAIRVPGARPLTVAFSPADDCIAVGTDELHLFDVFKEQESFLADREWQPMMQRGADGKFGKVAVQQYKLDELSSHAGIDVSQHLRTQSQDSEDGQWRVVSHNHIDGRASVRLVDRTFRTREREAAFRRFKAKSNVHYYSKQAHAAAADKDMYRVAFFTALIQKQVPSDRSNEFLKKIYGDLSEKEQALLKPLVDSAFAAKGE